MSVLRERLARRTLPALAGVRAISAFVVVAYHFGVPYVSAGFGVLAFFVLSGFLITWLLVAEEAKTGTVSLRGFYLRRTLRIFPAFYVYWGLLTTLMILRHAAINWPQAWASFFYVGNYYQGLNGYPSSGYSHTWSLGIEEQFYLLWPITFLWCPARWRVRLCAGVIGAIWIYRIALHLSGVNEAYIYTAFETRVDHLLVGCALALALRDPAWDGLWPHLTTRVARFATVAALGLSLVAAYRFGIPYRNTTGFLVDPVLLAILFVQLFAFDDWTTRWLEARPLVFLGTISYSTYLYQQVMMYPIATALRTRQVPEALTFIACALALYAAATLSYLLVERPVLRRRARREKARQVQPVPVLA